MNRGGRNAEDRDPSLWTQDWSDTSYWLDGLSPPDVPQVDLPPTVDVLIVGSGYTGLNAAIETARGGRSIHRKPMRCWPARLTCCGAPRTPMSK